MLFEQPQYVIWAVSLALFSSLYPLIHWVLGKHPRYAELPPHLQRYVVSNLLKAKVLGMYSTVLINLLLTVIYGGWDGDTLKALAPVYASLDLISLVMVPKMHTSTRRHHVLVGVFAAYISICPNETLCAATDVGCEIKRGTFAAACCAYGLFSMVAYFVNGFLALRFLASPESGLFVRRAAQVCAVGYAAVCAVHWPHQIWMAMEGPWYLPIIIAVAFYPFVLDDLKLMSAMWHYEPIEITVVLCKPDCVERELVDTVVQKFTEEIGEPFKRGYHGVDGLKTMFAEHYKEHATKAFYTDLVEAMSREKVYFFAFRGKGVVAKAREVLQRVREEHKVDFRNNTAHASDSPEAGIREYNLWFAS